MEINKVIDLIEKFAPIYSQEPWDNSGYQISFENREIKKILLCLTITKQIIDQAKEKKCDMIISHHPLFFIPFEFNKNIPIYSAHTNLDKSDNGTTDTLIDVLGFSNNKAQKIGDFLRLVTLDRSIPVKDFADLLKSKLEIKNIRIVNNLNKQEIKEIAFCSGSGADFISLAEQYCADGFVTGDVKYHTAMESNVIIFDIGHFESEKPVLKTLEKVIKQLGVETVIADEKSPFITC